MYEIISKAKKNNTCMGMYGLGIWGKGFAWRLFSYLEITIDFVSDRDLEKLDSFEKKSVYKLTLEELLNVKTETLVFIMLGQYYLYDALLTLKKNTNLIPITLDEVLNLDCVLEKFYGVNNIREYERKNTFNYFFEKKPSKNFKFNKKIAVYTCIINGYDELREPLIIEENCDYYLISDKKPDNLKIFKWINYKTIVPETYKEPAVINRYCKMHAHQIFCNYQYSIYMDGKVQLVAPISKYINDIGNIGIGIHAHAFINCIYVEGIRMVGVGTSNEENVIKQMKQYILEGMPRNFGTFECRVIVREHTNIIGCRIMEQWFEEYYHKEKRDQFSLSYILWKNGLAYNDIGLINYGKPWSENKDIECRRVHLK